jgi:hypothetical protein
MVDARIQKFIELHAKAEQLLNESQVFEAKQKYLDVLAAYQEIDKSNLDKIHKDIAYEQVTSLFKKVNDAKERAKVPANLIIAAALVVGFSTLVFFDPSIVGLAGFEDVIREQVNLTVDQPKLVSLTLKDRPLSFKVSGNITGGMAKLYVKQGEKLELIFDSEKSFLTQDGQFIEICEETCEINVDNNIVELFAQVEGGVLNVNEIIYTIKRTSNTPPRYTGQSQIFNAKTGEDLALNLDEYFTDDNADKLTYLSTKDEGLETQVYDNYLTLRPTSAGTKHIMIAASDLQDVTRVPITVEVS